MQKLERHQIDDAAMTMALAFHDDPLLLVMQPDESKRTEFGRWFLGMFMHLAISRGQFWGNEDASAAAVWLPPGETDMSTLDLLRAGMWRLPFKLGPRGSTRFLRMMSLVEPLHEAVDGPHWYLGMVGTRPELQGQGLGSELVKIGTDQADASGVPCYLETGTDENVAFYRKRGFEISGQAEFEGYTVYGMIRQPQQPA